MRRRDFIKFAATTWPACALAQESKLPSIGFLHSRGPTDARHVLGAYRRGLRDGGFIEGQNLDIEYRWADGRFERLPALAKELSRLPLSLVLAGGGESAPKAAQAAMPKIPIVFVMGGDPVKLGLAASINRPGGTTTGFSILSPLLDPKRLGLLRDIVPTASTIALLVNTRYSPSALQISMAQNAAREVGVRLRVFRANSEGDIEEAFEIMAAENIPALAMSGSPYFDTIRKKIVALAARYSIPAIYSFREYTLDGGLISYGVDLVETYRQAGQYTSQILKGAKPADLPVQLPTRFDLVINLRAAGALGLTIAPGILAIADEVIE
jgi:putative ABC transport system substrate-binding protein